MAFLLCFFLGGFVLAASQGSNNGEAFYQKKQYEMAIKEFEKQLQKDPKSVRTHSNLACTAFQLGRQEEALKHWKIALENSSNPIERGRINYNIGNYYFKAEQVDKAIESYKTALRLNPDDKLAKYNLEIALKQKQPPPPNKSNSNSPNNNDNQPPQPEDSPAPPKQNKKPQMSKDEAERLLNALQKSEKGPGQRAGSKEQNSPSTITGRDW